jgi:hypothetical protein
VCFFILVVGTVATNNAFGQIDILSELGFLQSGVIYTDENEFNVSNDINIREFFNGNIIRVSGQTIEGFPFITYSKISEENIDTYGIIFINNQFTKLSFIERDIESQETLDKKDDLALAIQYTQRAHSKQFISIDVKVFDKLQNNFSSDGITNDKGLFETKYLIPDNSKRETLTVTINAENESSSSSKILQAFVLGNIPSDGGP